MNEPLDQNSRLSTTLDALCAALQQFETSFQAQQADLGARVDRIVAAVSDRDAATQNETAARLTAAETKIAELEARNSELQHKLEVAASANMTAAAPPFSAAFAERVGSEMSIQAQRAQAETALRKTLPPSMCALLSKSAATDIDAAGHFDVATLDKTLASLSIDQRIAVKAEMARAGLIA